MTTVNNSTLGLVAGDNESFILNLNVGTNVVVKSGDAILNGIIVNSHSAGSMVIRDGSTIVLASTTLKFGTYSFATGSQFINFFGARFSAGLMVTNLGANDITILYK